LTTRPRTEARAAGLDLNPPPPPLPYSELVEPRAAAPVGEGAGVGRVSQLRQHERVDDGGGLLEEEWRRGGGGGLWIWEVVAGVDSIWEARVRLVVWPA
jgi:hypothetical protein